MPARPQQETMTHSQDNDSSFFNLYVKDKVSFLLYGSQSAAFKSSNHEILKFVNNYIKETVRFDRSLFCPNQ